MEVTRTVEFPLSGDLGMLLLGIYEPTNLSVFTNALTLYRSRFFLVEFVLNTSWSWISGYNESRITDR